MKSLKPFVMLLLIGLPFTTRALMPTNAGFFLPDSVQEMVLKYRTIRNLIVLPVTINDSVRVNLILDTGCRNLILFGKKFRKLLTINSEKPIRFSGLGTGAPITGMLSLKNKVSINDVSGRHIPVVVVDHKSIFSTYHNIHGVIGYDIFLKFEIELNARAKTITFRSAYKPALHFGYTRVPLRIVDARPVMSSLVTIGTDTDRMLDLMIDTGSSLGLLIKTTDISAFDNSTLHSSENLLGFGFNGPVSGYKVLSDVLSVDGFALRDIPTGIIRSDHQDSGSIGMEVLKDYVVILNYCKAYACFKLNGA
jgi:hypothetical protein